MPLVDQFGRQMPTTRQLQAAARRRNVRAQLEAAYDAAQTTAENVKHWRWADSLSASEANSPDIRKTIRERSRYEVANNSFAAGIVDTLAGSLVGTGPRLQVQTADTAANAAIEARWKQWAGRVRLAEKLRTARRAKAVDGESFLQRVDNPRRAGIGVTLDIRVIECDQFENLSAATTNPQHVSGIHFDNYGNPARYDFLEYHPGDAINGMRQGTPIDADDLIHLFRCDRPGQIRGISELTPALPLFAMLRRYTLAVLLAAETAADHAAVLETQSPPLDEDQNFDGDEVDPFDAVDIDRGMMTALPRGWKLSQFKPEQPATTYEMFRNAILNEIARCLGMPFNIAAGNSAGYNYSSGQLDHGGYDDMIAVERSVWENNCLEQIFSWWLDEALLIPGYLPKLPTFDAELPHRWYWKSRTHGDPAKQAKSVETLHKLGLLTDEAYLLGEGVDPEAHHEQRLRQARRRRELAAAEGITAAPAPAAKPGVPAPQPQRAAA